MKYVFAGNFVAKPSGAIFALKISIKYTIYTELLLAQDGV
jgi:hypothetical protein